MTLGGHLCTHSNAAAKHGIPVQNLLLIIRLKAMPIHTLCTQGKGKLQKKNLLLSHTFPHSSKGVYLLRLTRTSWRKTPFIFWWGGYSLVFGCQCQKVRTKKTLPLVKLFKCGNLRTIIPNFMIYFTPSWEIPLVVPSAVITHHWYIKGKLIQTFHYFYCIIINNCTSAGRYTLAS